MTTTTSKLGADMLTDEEIFAIADDNDSGRAMSGRRLFSERNLLLFARALLARQPAAIDKEAVTNSPFSNCKFRECDLPGQCRGEGACHHPRDTAPLANEAGKPAPSVEQDERGALVQQIGRMRKDETRGDTVFRCGFNGAIDAVIKLIELRAASTSANVAQGAEAVALWAAFDEQGMLLAHSKVQQGLSDILNWEPLYRAAPPAQPALTVTPAMVKAAMPWLTGLHHMRKTDKESHVEEAIKAALTAAQSASGDTK